MDSNDYPPIQQACVLLKSSTQPEAARRFLAYIQNPESSNILQQYGFEVPSATTTQHLQ